MDQVLLGEFHEEVGIEFDVEVDIAGGILGLGNVEIEGLIEESNALVSVRLLPPLDDRLEEHVLSRFAHRVPDLAQKLQLLLSVFQHFLLYAAVDHPVQGSHVRLVVACCFLVNCVGTLIVSLQGLLVANFCMKA
jgi:hypothetical protein